MSYRSKLPKNQFLENQINLRKGLNFSNQRRNAKSKDRRMKSDRFEKRKKTEIMKYNTGFNYSNIFKERNRYSLNGRNNHFKSLKKRSTGGKKISKNFMTGGNNHLNLGFNRRRKSKIRLTGNNQNLNSSGMSYFDSKDGIRAHKLSMNINDGSFLLNGKRSSSIKKRYRKSGEVEQRYSSVRRRESKTKKSSMKNYSKRSSSLHQTYSVKKVMKDKAAKKRKKLEMDVEEMRNLYKSDNYEGAILKGEEVLREYPQDVDSLYIYGLSCSMVDRHEDAVQIFNKLIEIEPRYKKTKTVYLFLSIGHKKLGDMEKGVEVLDQAINNFPKFYEAYIYRGKLHLKMRKIPEAVKDFSRAIEIESSKLSGYIGLGDCYRIQSEFMTAIQNYTIVLNQDKSIFEIIGLKRAICYIELKDYDLAEKDISKILDQNHDNCEAIYFKGLINMYKGQNQSAILNYEQAIKLNISETATIKSLHDIALIKIEERDIYAAYYTLQRVENIPENVKYLHNLKIFLDGAVSMVKKKFKEGLKEFDKIKGSEEINDAIKPMVLSYRAYGNFSLGNIEEALDDYKSLENKNQIMKGDVYNKNLCMGIIEAKKKNFDTAYSYFTQAHQIGKSKIEPPFYIWIMSIIRLLEENREEYEAFVKAKDKKSKEKYSDLKKQLILVVYEALEHLEKVLAENDSCSNLSFYVGYLKLSIGLENEAVENFNTAIDKSDDNMSLHYIWKGIALCMCNDYERALGEFRIALNVDPTDYHAGLYKGRCYLYKKEINRAFYAFKDFMDEGDREHEIKFWVGNCFFSNGMNNHADQFYTEALNIKKSEKCLKELVKCCIAEKNLIKALKLLQDLVSEYPNEAYKYDLKVLEALKFTSSQKFPKARNLFKDLFQVKYKGMVFSKSDLFFYYGFCCFYLGDYKTALENFKEAMDVKYSQESKCFEQMEEEALRNIFEGDESEERGPLTGQTFTKLEMTYNIALVHLMLGEKSEALKLLNSVYENKDEEGDQKSEFLGIICSILEDQVKKIVNIIEEGKIQDEDLDKIETEEDSEDGFAPSNNKDLDKTCARTKTLSIFPISNRLCGIYDQACYQLNKDEILKFRLSFCLPFIELPDMSIKVGFEILKDIKISSIENRPEAPWIKRTSSGIVFTNNLIEKEAYEVYDVKELIDQISHDKEAVVNTRVKLNAEKIFENHRNAENQKEKEKKNAHLLELKQNLMLDLKTEQLLSNMMNKSD